jgi:hypothetical protein
MPLSHRARASPIDGIPQALVVDEDAGKLLEHIDALKRRQAEGDYVQRVVVERAERSGKAPLHLAAWRGGIDVIDALLRHGAVSGLSRARRARDATRRDETRRFCLKRCKLTDGIFDDAIGCESNINRAI